jgi:hypothetical protein
MTQVFCKMTVNILVDPVPGLIAMQGYRGLLAGGRQGKKQAGCQKKAMDGFHLVVLPVKLIFFQDPKRRDLIANIIRPFTRTRKGPTRGAGPFRAGFQSIIIFNLPLPEPPRN